MMTANLLSFVFVGLSFGAAPPVSAQQLPAPTPDLQTSVEFYTQRYNLSSPFQSAADDRGRGLGELQGLRNFRAVLPGILYRAGGNNAYRNLYGQRALPNQNPLPAEAIANLCKQGFARAFYVYGKKSFVGTTIDCQSFEHDNSFAYEKLHPQNGGNDTRTFLSEIHDHIVGRDHRPVLVHCWNGYHASGVAAAIALRQFCGLSQEDAQTYWETTARPLDKAHWDASLRTIANFTPIPALAITAAQRQIVCFHEPITGQKAQWVTDQPRKPL